MSTLSPMSSKRIAKAKSSGKSMRGTFIIDVKELQARQSDMSKVVADALFGKAKGPQDQRKVARRAAMAMADKYFSMFIRLRDADENGRVTCVTCSHTGPWRHLQCGHFVTRGHQSTRYDELNSSCQCRGCNYNGGQHLKHATAIDRKHGEGTAKKLEDKGRMRCQRTTQDFLFLAECYRLKVENIKINSTSKFTTT